MFDSCSSKLCHEVTWQDVYELIRSDALRTKTEAVRAMCQGLDGLPKEERQRREKEVKRMKATWFPGLLPACHCKDGVRQLEQVTDYTGFSHVDFDHIPDEQLQDIKARLREVPEVLLMHTSIRGQGLHIYYRLEPSPKPDGGRAYQDTYIQGFRQGNVYFAKVAGLPYDPALEPPVHLSCPCYDPEVYFNPDAIPFRIDSDIILDKYGKPVSESARDGKKKKKRKRSGRGDDGNTKVEQIADFLQSRRLRWDMLSRKVQAPIEGSTDHETCTMWQELSERGINNLFVECCQSTGRNLSFQDFRHVLNSGVVPEVNPLREYILGLPEWDGERDYINEVAGMVTIQSEKGKMKNEKSEEERGLHDVESLWRSCFKKWFVAMVASWMRDDVVNHQVLVLIGEQGIFKTTWLDALMPPELASYRCRQSGARALDKDEQLRATEFGLVNMDEIDRMSEQELNALKSLITASDINVRAAYAQTKERRLRVASYVASGNKERFLTDTTGNRRWLPFHVKAIDSPFEHPMPYTGMYAQAWALVRNGFNYWFNISDIQQLATHVDEFSVETNEEQLLPVYFSPCMPGTNGAVLLTVAEISAKLTLYGNIRRPMDVRQLGALLKKMGYVSKRAGHGKPRGYVVQEKSADSINAERKLHALAAAEPIEPIEPIPF